MLNHYGNPPDVELLDCAIPQPRHGEIRVRVSASGLNPIDAKRARGELAETMPQMLPAPLASDVAAEMLDSGIADIDADHVIPLRNGVAAMVDYTAGRLSGKVAFKVVE